MVNGKNYFGRNGSSVALSEVWMKKFLEFLREYPEDIQKKWQCSLDVLIQMQVVEDLPYRILLNPGRANRLEIKKTPGIKIPNYAESVENYQRGRKNTAIFGIDYDPYFVLVNIFPIMPGHTTLVYKSLNDWAGVNKEVKEKDLETIAKFTDATGSMAWHNMPGAAVTIPSWEHWQACVSEPAVRYTKKEPSSSGSEVYFMPKYPGSNAVFNGKDKIKNASKVIKILRQKNISYVVGVDAGYVYIIPVKNDRAGTNFGLDDDSRIGGFELINGAYIALNQEDYKKAYDIGVDKILGKTTYPISELSLLNYV